MVPRGDGGRMGAQRRDVQRVRVGWGEKDEGQKKGEESVTVAACASTCVCLCMSAAACLHVSLNTFMHECVCVAWRVGAAGMRRAINSRSLT